MSSPFGQAASAVDGAGKEAIAIAAATTAMPEQAEMIRCRIGVKAVMSFAFSR